MMVGTDARIRWECLLFFLDNTGLEIWVGCWMGGPVVGCCIFQRNGAMSTILLGSNGEVLEKHVLCTCW